MNKSKTKIEVTQPDEPVAAKVIATSITEIDRHMKAMLTAGLKREAIIALVHDSSGIAKGTIRIVLNNLEDLKSQWCSR